METTNGNHIVPEYEKLNTDTVHLTVTHNGLIYPFDLPSTTPILSIKHKLEETTKVPVTMQKLIFRGILSDTAKLVDLKLPAKGAKFMLIGSIPVESKLPDTPTAPNSKSGDASASNDPSTKATMWSEQKEHKRILEQFGKPDNAMIGIINVQDALSPNESLSGLYDKRGNIMRMCIKSDSCELWLATNSFTHRFPLASIHDVVSEPIKDHPEYHIMGIQLGPTPKSRFFIYWLPAQYVNSVRTLILQHKIIR